jgi:hypothetical protein
MTLEKKTLLHMVRRGHSSCAPNTIYTVYENIVGASIVNSTLFSGFLFRSFFVNTQTNGYGNILLGCEIVTHVKYVSPIFS